MPTIKVEMPKPPEGAYKKNKEWIWRRYPITYHHGRWRHKHKVVAEKALGRRLKEGEVVHHIDGDRLNYSNNNLLVCSARYHRQLHRRCLERYGTWHLPNLGRKANERNEKHFRRLHTARYPTPYGW